MLRQVSLALLLLTTTTAALGQAPVGSETEGPVAEATSEEPVARARELFLEARAHFDGGRFGDARDSLRESLSLAPRPGTATNLARVLVQMQRALEAEAVVRRVLNGDFGELSEDQSRSARDLLQITDEEIGAIEVTLSGARTLTFQLDDEVASTHADGDVLSRRIDPGAHALRLSSEDGRQTSTTVELLPGQRQTLRLSLEPVSPATTDEPTETRSAARSPWLWIGILVGAAAIGTGLYFALRPVDADADPVWGQAQGLSF